MAGRYPTSLADHHVHLFSAASKAHLEREVHRSLPTFTATELLATMAKTGWSRRPCSVAYFFDRGGEDADGDAAVRAENDWT